MIAATGFANLLSAVARHSPPSNSESSLRMTERFIVTTEDRASFVTRKLT